MGKTRRRAGGGSPWSRETTGASLCETLSGMFGFVAVSEPDGMLVGLRHEWPASCGGGWPSLWDLPWTADAGKPGGWLRDGFRKALAGEASRGEVGLALPGCEPRVLELALSRVTDGGRDRVLACGTDVTRRAGAERRRRDADERLRLAMDAANVGTWELDLDTGTIVTERRTGALKERIGTLDEFLSRLSTEERAAALADMERALREYGRYHRDHRLEGRDGGTVWLRASGRVEPKPGGKGKVMRGVAVDVTGRKTQELAFVAATEEIVRREGHLRSILATVPSAMVVMDEDGVVTMFSAAAESLFGWKAREVLGRKIEVILPCDEEEGEDPRKQLMGWCAGRRNAEMRGMRKDGASIPVEVFAGTADLDGIRYVTVFMRDLTEDRATEARLVELTTELTHVSRLSAMGQLASMLAHELNQPLAAATNYVGACSLLLEGLPPDPAREPLGLALAQASVQMMRAGRIIANLRDFVARRRTERRVERAADLVEAALSLGFVGAAQDDVTLRRSVQKDLPPVSADRVQVQQVLVNLVRNALEAMAGSQRRVLTVSVARMDDEDAVRFSVSDTGPGIAPEIRDGLFTPFATTKDAGIGVGLSICRTIVEAHGGRIWVEEGGKGTTFSFTLQAAAGPAGSR